MDDVGWAGAAIAAGLPATGGVVREMIRFRGAVAVEQVRQRGLAAVLDRMSNGGYVHEQRPDGAMRTVWVAPSPAPKPQESSS
jgi:hypothetical protein